MHPALSVIFFTAVSGTGYGLLFLLGLFAAIDPQRLDPLTALIGVALGAIFAAAGLTSSLLHLGQPLRAWRAFSQWRSSWLSREGWAALLCFVPMMAFGTLLWHDAHAPAAMPNQLVALRILGAALAACATLTVFCTARIYTSLKTIHAWHNHYVLPGYLLLGLLGGAAWLWVVAALADDAPMPTSHQGLPALIGVLAIAALVLKHAYWRYIDTTTSASTPESATGLGAFGNVSGVEAPHTEENYLTREMGFALARKHAGRLRRIATLLFGVLPALLAVLSALMSAPHALALSGAVVTAASATAGIFVERWLFFAQARHVVMLYYGRGSDPDGR